MFLLETMFWLLKNRWDRVLFMLKYDVNMMKAQIKEKNNYLYS